MRGQRGALGMSSRWGVGRGGGEATMGVGGWEMKEGKEMGVGQKMGLGRGWAWEGAGYGRERQARDAGRVEGECEVGNGCQQGRQVAGRGAGEGVSHTSEPGYPGLTPRTDEGEPFPWPPRGLRPLPTRSHDLSSRSRSGLPGVVFSSKR